MKLVEQFGKRFSQICEGDPLSGMNNIQKGKYFGVSNATISDYMTGKKMPSMETSCRIALRCNVNIEWLLTGRGERQARMQSVDALYDAIASLPADDQATIERHAQALLALQDSSSA